MAHATETATVVFTDLADSTRLRADLGEHGADELRRHHDAALADVVAAHHGQVVKGAGDGIVATFEAASQGVAAAVAMQQAIEVLGWRRRLKLAIRVGVSAGDVSWEGGDCFGLPVVEAARLEAMAQPGQILCSDVVRVLARGRAGAAFSAVGELELKGLAEPLVAWEVGWEPVARAAASLETTLVGRDDEVAALRRCWQAATAGRGGLAVVDGDAGVGKSRLLSELVGLVERSGGATWLGSCYEGDPRAYGVFADSLDRFVRTTDPAELAGLLGPQASLLSRLAPAVLDVLAGLEPASPVLPEEERHRLHDAVAVVAARVSSRRPLLVVLDDGHWADAPSVSLLTLLARRAVRERMLVVVAHRRVDLPADHALALALPPLRREPTTVGIPLSGLDAPAVSELVEALASEPVAPPLSVALHRETGGNPFFVREVVLHLAESGRLQGDAVQELDLPQSVRDLVGRRIAPLSEPARRIVAVASAFEAGFSLPVVAAVAGVEEGQALDAVDECLAAQVVRPTDRFDVYEFTHALFRHALWSEHNPSRRARLHRAIAERLAAVADLDSSPADAAAIAHHYRRSAQLPGADRGVPFALAAAEHAASRHLAAEEFAALALAVELADANDDRVPGLHARAAQAALLAGSELDTVLSHADAALRSTAEREGPEAACRAAVALGRLAERMDMTAAWSVGRLVDSQLRALDPHSEWSVQLRTWQLNEAEYRDPTNPGTPMDSPLRRQLNAAAVQLEPRQRPAHWLTFPSSRALLEDYATHGGRPPGPMLAYLVGDYRAAVGSLRSSVDRALQRGLVPTAVWHLGMLGRVHLVLGDLDAAARAQAEGEALLDRVEPGSNAHFQFHSLDFFRCLLVDDDADRAQVVGEPLLAHLSSPELHWVAAAARLLDGWAAARAGRTEPALAAFTVGLDVTERALPGTANLTGSACALADMLWQLDRRDEIAAVERNLRTKVIEPDFCFAEFDGRWAMAQVCALTGRADEARAWFQRAIDRVRDQGAVLLVPHIAADAARAEVRAGPAGVAGATGAAGAAGAAGDRALARRRLEEARREIDRIGLPRLLPRVEALAGQLGD